MNKGRIIGRKAVSCLLMLLLCAAIPVCGQSFRQTHSAFEDGDDYHFGYISGSVGYSMLQTNLPNAMSHGNAGGSIGLGYEFRNSGLWANVGMQMSFHRSSLTIDEKVFHIGEPGTYPEGYDAQGERVTFNYRVNQVDKLEWNYLDVPVLIGYYIRGFHVGAGIKVSYALNPTTLTSGTYDLSATYHKYDVTVSDLPERGYMEYSYEGRQSNHLNVGASLIGEIGYDLLSSMPSRSRICHILKLAFYFEYGLNTQMRKWENPPMQLGVQTSSTQTVVDARKAVLNPYVNTFEQAARTVPFFTGVKLTYMIGSSRTARVASHHGCMCYN